MYYHHVSQSGDAYTPTIAVNYWLVRFSSVQLDSSTMLVVGSGFSYLVLVRWRDRYNMAFDVKYAYFSLVEKLATRAQLSVI